MLLLNNSFVMIYMIHKMLVLLKNHLNILKLVSSNAFLRSITDFQYFFKKNIILFITYNNGEFKS